MAFPPDYNAPRRQFLRTAGAALAGLAGSHLPAFAYRDDAASPHSTPLRLGSGEHTYDCLHDWLTPPSHIRWGDTQGVAQDRAGRIYISHTVHPESPSRDAIVVFDKNGKFLSSWGSRFAGGGHGLDIRREERPSTSINVTPHTGLW
jgi:hypothetical protein